MPVNDKKRAYGAKLGDYIDTYKQALIVSCDNVGSRQMQQIRLALRGTAVVLMGKNVRYAALDGGEGRARGECGFLGMGSGSTLHSTPLPLSADHHPQGDQGLPQEQ